MAFEEVIDEIVETFDLNINPKETWYLYYAAGLKKVNDFTSEETIYEGMKVPNISIETNNITDWLSVLTESDELSPTYVIVNITDDIINTTGILNLYAKIYLRYNDLYTGNYIYITFLKLFNIVLYDRDNDDFVFVNGHLLNDVDYPLSQYTPIGIEVVPREHNVYGNKCAGVMSFKLMDVLNPDTGTINYATNNALMTYGQNTIYTPLTNYDLLPTINNTDTGDITGIVTDTEGYLPSDYYYDKIICLHDKNSYYYSSKVTIYPSPYLTDGSRNPKYYLTESPSSSLNALSDFNGKSNTETLCNLATALYNWKTDSSIIKITNIVNTSGYSPAACCCWRYHTDGTNQGDWYLPACGELGYWSSRSKIIENTILKVIDTYGNTYAVNCINYNYYSLLCSTERNSVSIYVFDKTGYIMYVAKEYLPMYAKAFIQIKENALANIVLYDKTNNNFVFVNAHILNNTDYPLSKYTPIGVEVVPKEHNVYGNGKAGVMALKCMSCYTPDTGTSSYETIYWGLYNINTQLNDYNIIPLVTNDINCTIISTKISGYIPTDKNTNVNCLHDKDAYYYANSVVLCPSPYLTDGSRNPKYYLTESPSSSSNALSDFDGVNNTLILCNLATALPNWKTDSSIINDTTYGFSPAACCCLRYYTDGTNPGDWHLPACGELGYFISRINMLILAFRKITATYGTNYECPIYFDENIYTSSEYNAKYSRIIDFNGYITIDNKYVSNMVYAFICI